MGEYSGENRKERMGDGERGREIEKEEEGEGERERKRETREVYVISERVYS